MSDISSPLSVPSPAPAPAAFPAGMPAVETWAAKVIGFRYSLSYVKLF